MRKVNKKMEEPFKTNKYQKQAIFQAKQQVKKGLVIENEKVEKEIDKLLLKNKKKY